MTKRSNREYPKQFLEKSDDRNNVFCLVLKKSVKGLLLKIEKGTSWKGNKLSKRGKTLLTLPVGAEDNPVQEDLRQEEG